MMGSGNDQRLEQGGKCKCTHNTAAVIKKICDDPQSVSDEIAQGAEYQEQCKA